MSAAAGSTHPSQPGLAVLTAEQRENYEILTARRKEWLTELAPDFDKKTRADATGLAFNILLSGEDDPKQAMMLAVEQISARQALQDQLGRNLFLSSEADPLVDPPVVQQVQAQQQIQPQQNAAPHPPQLLAPLQEGNPQLAPLQEGNNDAPAQVPENPKDKGKAKRVDSDSDDAKRKKKKAKRSKKRASKRTTHSSSTDSVSDSDSDSSGSSSDSSSSSSSEDSLSSNSDNDKKKRRSDIKWKKGKVNSSAFGALHVPDNIAAKVQKNKFIDLWYFTAAACAPNITDRPITKQWKVEGTSLTSTDKKHPKGFVPDHDLSPVDFLYAIDQWVDTMRQEGVDEDTCQAWKRFNTKIRKHTDWPDPSGHGKKQLQLLHNHQRICFASETRQEKARKRAMKKKYSSKEKRAKALDKLVKFDPAEWPADGRGIQRDREANDDVTSRLLSPGRTVPFGPTTPPPPLYSSTTTTTATSPRGQSHSPLLPNNPSHVRPSSPFGPAPVSKLARAVGQEHLTTRDTARRTSSPATRPSQPSASTTPTADSSRASATNESAQTTTRRNASSQPASGSTPAPSAGRPNAMLNAALSPPIPRLPANLQLNAEGWSNALLRHGLLHRYQAIVPALKEGLHIGVPTISRTHIAKHLGSTTNEPTKVETLIDNELKAGRYAGPNTSSSTVEGLLGGPFQTSPLGLRVKANGKFRLIQDFSSPHNDDDPTPRGSKKLYKARLRRSNSHTQQQPTPPPTQPTPLQLNVRTRSINSQLRVEDWPTTWCTTEDMCRTILMRPHTAQAFVRDTISAFRQVPLHPSQWPGTGVEWKGQFYVDRFLAFGLGPACGAYGLFGDAFADLARAEGISPNGHWVDDNVFLRFKATDLALVNKNRRVARATISPSPVHQYGRTFWADSQGNKHAEDYSQPARILPDAEDGFNCGLSDIDRLSNELGWPWAPEKDAPWASTFTYGGLEYHIATKELALPEKKRTKYLAAVHEWQTKTDGTHT